VWCVESPTGYDRRSLAVTFTSNLHTLFPEELPSELTYRGVEIERLGTILVNGCDVEPTHVPFFAARLDKALEYCGNEHQVIQVFRQVHLKPCWQEHPATLSDEERAAIEKDYPTVLPSRDGIYIWFSRLKPDDTRLCSYERDYSYWIPGPASEALVGLIIVTADMNHLLSHLQKKRG
jgi:hypothetical protein